MMSLMLFLVGALNILFACNGKNKWLNIFSWLSCGLAWFVAYIVY